MAETEADLQRLFVADVMRKDYCTIPADEPCSKALSHLVEHGDGVVLVTNGKGQLEGLVAERDILRSGKAPDATPVRTVMEPAPRAAPTDRLVDGAKQMLDANVRGLPVLERDKPVGLCALEDIIRTAARGPLGAEPVLGFSTREIRVIHTDDSVARALSLMRKEGFSRLPVLRDGKLVGIVTLHDVLRLVVARMDPDRDNQGLGEVKHPLSIPVEGVMSSPVVSIARDANYRQAVALMLEHNIGSLVVTRPGTGFPQAIVTRRDLLEPVALLASNVPALVVSFSSKDTSRDGYETSGAAEEVKAFLARYRAQIEPALLTINAKKQKNRFHRTDLWHVRLGLVCHLGKFHAVGEGWGMQHATRLALDHLEREVRREKEERAEHPTREFIEDMLY